MHDKYVEMLKERVQPDRSLGSNVGIWEDLKNAFLYRVELENNN